MKIINNVGDSGHPCLTPFEMIKGSVVPVFVIIDAIELLYIS